MLSGYPGSMRSVVITGVSRGLGAALFEECHSAGDRILALGRRFTEAQRVVERQGNPGDVVLRTTDLANPSSLPTTEELWSFLDRSPSSGILFLHNAGVFEPFGPIGTLEVSAIVTAIDVNVISPVLLTNALLARSPGERNLTVMYISSSAAHRIGGGRSVYGSAKRACELFFTTLEEEHRDDPHLRVAIVDPGIMDTDMQLIIRRHAREDAYFPGRERFLTRYERGELPSPAETAHRILERDAQPGCISYCQGTLPSDAQQASD